MTGSDQYDADKARAVDRDRWDKSLRTLRHSGAIALVAQEAQRLGLPYVLHEEYEPGRGGGFYSPRVELIGPKSEWEDDPHDPGARIQTQASVYIEGDGNHVRIYNWYEREHKKADGRTLPSGSRGEDKIFYRSDGRQMLTANLIAAKIIPGPLKPVR